ncbi:MAG TPA: Gfo/Idh/MocA family oxidoreductase [Pseudonocardiaceae bacterium]|jgi:predicted dehydrogenase
MGVSAPSPLRVGLLGYGLAGSVFHAPLIATTEGLRLDAVVTANPQRRAQVLRDHPQARVMDSAEQLLASDSVDLVVVATPNRSHVPLARLAVQAGLPVVVDKPLAATAAEGRELVAEARRQGVLLTVFQNRRWDGDYLTVRRLLREDVLGTVSRFESRFERWRPTVRERWRELPAPEEAGGLLFDLGSHLVDQALQLFGPVVSVYAEVERRRPGAQVDDDAFVALTHEAGTHSHLWMSAVAAQLGPRMRVLGDRAGYTKYGLDVQEEALRAGGRPDRGSWGADPPHQWGKVGVDGDLRELSTEPGCYQRFYGGLVAAVRDGAAMPVDPSDSVTVLEILEMARNSASRGAAVTIPTKSRI